MEGEKDVCMCDQHEHNFPIHMHVIERSILVIVRRRRRRRRRQWWNGSLRPWCWYAPFSIQICVRQKKNICTVCSMALQIRFRRCRRYDGTVLLFLFSVERNFFLLTLLFGVLINIGHKLIHDPQYRDWNMHKTVKRNKISWNRA